MSSVISSVSMISSIASIGIPAATRPKTLIMITTSFFSVLCTISFVPVSILAIDDVFLYPTFEALKTIYHRVSLKSIECYIVNG